MSWKIYPLDDVEDVDTFEDEAYAMNAAGRLADASGRDYRVVSPDGNRSFTIEPEYYS